LDRLCQILECQIQDICQFTPNENNADEE